MLSVCHIYRDIISILPRGILYEIDKCICRFLWRGSSDLGILEWTIVCLEIDCGWYEYYVIRASELGYHREEGFLD